MSAKPFQLGTTTLAPGERRTIDLPVSALSNHTPLTLPVHVVHGEKAGPVLFLSAVVHGDDPVGQAQDRVPGARLARPVIIVEEPGGVIVLVRRPAAVRPVIHRAMPIAGERPQIVELNLHQPGFARPANDSIIERPAKKIGEDGDDVNLHESALSH